MNNTTYRDAAVRGFTISAICWLLAGLASGIWLSLELLWPGLNLAPWLAYGRLRVVHTSSLIFGFGLGSIFATAYYVLQHLTRSPLVFPGLAKAHLILFNFTISAGIIQGSMLKATTPDGSLRYTFPDTLAALNPLYLLRAASGVVYFAGIVLFCWNIMRTFTNRPEPEQN